jgi:hypothetical protein
LTRFSSPKRWPRRPSVSGERLSVTIVPTRDPPGLKTQVQADQIGHLAHGRYRCRVRGCSSRAAACVAKYVFQTARPVQKGERAAIVVETAADRLAHLGRKPERVQKQQQTRRVGEVLAGQSLCR